VSGEYLLWTIKDSRIPPLATAGPPASFGILGQPGTRILLGNYDEPLSHNYLSGGRFGLGHWFDPCHEVALEGNFFFLSERSNNFYTNSNAFPVLARPYFDINTGQEFAELVAFPGLATGSLTARMDTKLWGAEANLRRNVCGGCFYRFDVLGGFRYLDLDEDLTILEDINGLSGAGAFAGSHIFVSDRFSTRNQFFGPQVGGNLELRYNRWSLELRSKVAVGWTHQIVQIGGNQLVIAPNGSAQAFQGGLLALPSNSGRFVRDRFSVVPELGVNLGYNVTDNLKLYVGYTFIYWSNVLRPGDQIDRVLDSNQIPNTPPAPPARQRRPLVPFRDTDFWAHGVNFGLQYSF
jgi:hypothetical protein